MKNSLPFRIIAPLLAFLLSFGGTTGLTLWAAEGKATRKAERKAAPAAKAKADEDKVRQERLRKELEQALAATRAVDRGRFVGQRVVPRPGDVKVLRLALAFFVP